MALSRADPVGQKGCKTGSTRMGVSKSNWRRKAPRRRGKVMPNTCHAQPTPPPRPCARRADPRRPRRKAAGGAGDGDQRATRTAEIVLGSGPSETHALAGSAMALGGSLNGSSRDATPTRSMPNRRDSPAGLECPSALRLETATSDREDCQQHTIRVAGPSCCAAGGARCAIAIPPAPPR
jgi:hypothetical protein